nr:hypothetical protein [Tanacetum cinerariifolium]
MKESDDTLIKAKNLKGVDEGCWTTHQRSKGSTMIPLPLSLACGSCDGCKDDTNQAAEIEKLKKRVKKPEGKKKKRTHRLKRRIAKIDADEDLSLINETAQDQRRMNDEDLFGVYNLDGDEVIVDVTIGENVEQDAIVAKKEVSVVTDEVVTTAESVESITAATTPEISNDDVILAQTLIEIKAAKPRSRGLIVQEPSKFRTTSSLQPSQLPQAKDKALSCSISSPDLLELPSVTSA